MGTLLLLLFLIALPRAASADPAPTPRLAADVLGSINAAVRVGNVLYVGGDFNRVSPFSATLGSLYGLSPATGAPATTLPLTDGEVFAIEPDGAGGYYIGGTFTTIGGVARRHLAHVLADGTVDPGFQVTFATAFESVRSIARDGNRLYIAGGFLSVNAATRPGVAALDATSGAVTPWVPSVPNGRKVVVANGRVIVVGSTGVVSVGATALDPTSGAVVWQRTLGEDSFKPFSPYSAINEVLAVGNRVIVGGRFGKPGAPQCVGTLVFLDATTGTPDPAFTPSPADCGEVRALAVHDGTLYVGGDFASLRGQPRANAAGVDLSSGLLTAWTPQPNGAVNALAIGTAGQVYLGGSFRSVSGQPRDGLAEIDAAQSITPWVADAHSFHVNTINASDPTVVIVGSSQAVSGGTERQNLAAFDLGSGTWLDWQPSPNFNVSHLTAAGSTIYVAGTFTEVSGNARRNLAALDGTTGAVLPWNPSPAFPISITAVVADNDYLYLAGFFDGYLRRVHRLTGALVGSWAPGPQSPPAAMLLQEGTLYIGGSFTTVGGQSRASLAAIDTASGTVTAWDPVLSGTVFSLAMADNVLIVGGLFSSFGGQVRANLGAVATTSDTVLPWAPETNASVRHVAVADRQVIVAGEFTTLGGQPRDGLGTIAFSGAIAAWSPAHGTPNALVATESDVIAVGNRARFFTASHVSIFGLPDSSRPSSLRVEAIDNVVSLSWSAPSSGAPTGYRIEAGTRSGLSDIGTFVVSGSAASVTAVVPNEPASEPSNEERVVVGCVSAPLPPTNLNVSLNGHQVALAWTPSAGASRYLLEVGSGFRATDIASLTLADGQSSFTAVGVPSGTYFVRARAANACDTSAVSSELIFTVGAAVPLPAAPTGLGATVDDSIVSLSWAAPAGAVTGYLLEAGSQPGQADSSMLLIGPTTGVSVPGVPPGVYYVRLRAMTDAGMGPPSAEITVIVP